MSFCSRVCQIMGCGTDACKNNTCNCCSNHNQELTESRTTAAAQPVVAQPQGMGSPLSSSSIIFLQPAKQSFSEIYLRACKEFPAEAMAIFAESLDPTYISEDVVTYFKEEGWKDSRRISASYDEALCDLFKPFLEQLKDLRKALLLQKAKERMEELEAKSRSRSVPSLASAVSAVSLEPTAHAGELCLESALQRKPKISCLNDLGNTITAKEIETAVFDYMDEICVCNPCDKETAFSSIRSLIKENMTLKEVRKFVLEYLLKDLETNFKKPDLEKLKETFLTTQSGEEVPFDEELLIADLKSLSANLSKPTEEKIIIRVELQVEALMPTAKILELITKEIHRFPGVELEQIDPEIEAAMQELNGSDSSSCSSSGLRKFARDKLSSLYGKVYDLHNGRKERMHQAANRVRQFVRTGVTTLLHQVKEEDIRKEEV